MWCGSQPASWWGALGQPTVNGRICLSHPSTLPVWVVAPATSLALVPPIAVVLLLSAASNSALLSVHSPMQLTPT